LPVARHTLTEVSSERASPMKAFEMERAFEVTHKKLDDVIKVLIRF
jgi:hypothetical protein